jgi:hypothetical protein
MSVDNQFVGYILYDYHQGYLVSHTELERSRYLVNFSNILSEAYVFSNLYPIRKLLKKTDDAIDYKGFILLRLFKQQGRYFDLPPLMSELCKLPVADEMYDFCIENYQTTEQMFSML